MNHETNFFSYISRSNRRKMFCLKRGVLKISQIVLHNLKAGRFKKLDPSQSFQGFLTASIEQFSVVAFVFQVSVLV